VSSKRVLCEHCPEEFEVAASLQGGLANCPNCGRATAVPGGAEALFIFAVALGVLLGGGATWFIWVSAGTTAGLITAACAVTGLLIAIAAS
jgi:hypothetical protein